MSKKVKIIILSVVITALAAAACALIAVKLAGKHNNDTAVDNSSILNSDTLSDNSSDNESIVSEPVTEEKTDFKISTPNSTSVSTTENTYTFMGKADPEKPLTLNGNEVKLTENGIFSVTVDLKEGKNTFTFAYDNKNYVYNVNYRFVIIESYSPKTDQSYSSGSTLAVSVKARKGCTVTAAFNGKTITLKEYIAQNENENADSSDTFTDFSGTFTLPETTKNMNLGKITFKAVYKGSSETFTSGNITCKKAEIPVKYDPNAAPLGGKYINVGTGKIAEIVAYEAETFDPRSTDDCSRPTNNYLPKGTVDYSAQGHIYYQGSEKKEYALLRYGRQVYISKKSVPTNKTITVVKEYKGTLPDHNEIGIAAFEEKDNHTVLTLDTLWKAPFYFDILPQSYTNPSKQDYTVSKVTCNYIDITLCYTTKLTGSITVPKTNTLFSSAKIIKNKSDYTIRLYLRKQGGFYGWDANYNSKGQLVFEFLNPARVSKAANSYGANLSGIKVLIDVGHGGTDPGALGFDSKNHSEAIQNLLLAKKIKAQLESTGAVVYMTRSSDITSSNDDKIQMLKKLKPDFCIAIHHDSSKSSSANGLGVYYSHSFAKKAAELILSHTKSTGIYKNSKLSWHLYYMARSSYCPVVLTENGFMTSTYDYNNIISDAQNNIKARAVTQGIADYFLAISPDDVPLPPVNEPDTSSEPSSSEEPSKPSIPSEPSEPADSSDSSSGDTSSDNTSGGNDKSSQ